MLVSSESVFLIFTTDERLCYRGASEMARKSRSLSLRELIWKIDLHVFVSLEVRLKFKVVAIPSVILAPHVLHTAFLVLLSSTSYFLNTKAVSAGDDIVFVLASSSEGQKRSRVSVCLRAFNTWNTGATTILRL